MMAILFIGLLMYHIELILAEKCHYMILHSIRYCAGVRDNIRSLNSHVALGFPHVASCPANYELCFHESRHHCAA